MKFFDKIKQTICLKVLSLLGYLITFYTIYWDFFYSVSTEEELTTKELNAIYFGFYFYIICFIILLLLSIELLLKKSFQNKTNMNYIYKIGLCLHIIPILNIFVIILIPLLRLIFEL